MAAPDAPREVSAARIVSQGLAAPLPDPVAAVEALLAIQGQQPSAIPWAIGVRAEGAARSDIEEAFERVELVRSWPMRGTVHVTSARDHHWLRACLAHRYSAWLAQTSRNGLAQSVVDRAGQLAVQEIARSGPRTRAQLVEVWQDAGIAVGGPGAVGNDAPGSPVNRRHLMVRLHIDGVLAQGPVRGNEHLVVDASSLPAAGDVAKGGAAHAEALALLAERYARGHGPVSAQDLARWASLPISEARRALAAAVEASRGGAFPSWSAPGVRARGSAGSGGRAAPPRRRGVRPAVLRRAARGLPGPVLLDRRGGGEGDLPIAQRHVQADRGSQGQGRGRAPALGRPRVPRRRLRDRALAGPGGGGAAHALACVSNNARLRFVPQYAL